MKDITIKRGDIYYYDFGNSVGSIQNGKRPVLVLQTEIFSKTSPTVIVAAITSVNKKKYLPSHIYLGERFGLSKPSMVLLEQMRTINKHELIDYVGFVDDELVWKNINHGLKKTFGLWIYNKNRLCEVHCLCKDCLNKYMQNKNLIMHRVNPFNRKKTKCDMCNNFGYDYILLDKRKRI